jgi:cell division protease FtsH
MDAFDFTDANSGQRPNPAKTALFWVALLCTAILLWKVMNNQSQPNAERISYSRFQDEVSAGNVARITLHRETEVNGKFKNGGEFLTTIPATDPTIFPLLREHAVEIEVRSDGGSPVYISVLLNLSPFILLLAFWFFMMRQMNEKAKQMGQGQ